MEETELFSQMQLILFALKNRYFCDFNANSMQICFQIFIKMLTGMEVY